VFILYSRLDLVTPAVHEMIVDPLICGGVGGGGRRIFDFSCSITIVDIIIHHRRIRVNLMELKESLSTYAATSFVMRRRIGYVLLVGLSVSALHSRRWHLDALKIDVKDIKIITIYV
jgi:hypothetical protein